MQGKSGDEANLGAESPDESQPAIDAIPLAAGLLWSDRRILLPLFLLLLIPSLIESFFRVSSISGLMGMLVLQRTIQLVFLLIITHRWINRLRLKPQALAAGTVIRFMAAGYLAWFSLISPLMFQLAETDDQSRLVGLFLMVPVIFLWLRYYFYFLPIAFGIKGWREILHFSHSLVQRNWKTPLYTIAAPLGIVGLISGLIYAPAPDGRVAELQYMATVTAEFFWPMCCYLSLAYGFSMIGEREWRMLQLEPYKRDRFETITKGSPGMWTSALRPRNGVKLLFIAALVWLANKIQLETTPPAPEIKIVNASMNDDRVTLKLSLSDERYHFRGFQPVHFVLAGENRHLVSVELENVRSAIGDLPGLRFELPSRFSEVDLTLTFKTNRSGEALSGLKDLYLWYRLSKLAKVDLSSSATQQVSPNAE
ncbi:MAG: hypothetical protein J5J00_10610 [Deltaproteobacteria bacterium]|nr:hypothetical protein [Deltaproteobacteria bacterium]